MHDKLHQLASQFNLQPLARSQLWHIAEINSPPKNFAKQLQRLLIIVAALLIGVGAIFWIAANWQQWGKFVKFGLVEASLVCATVGALFSSKGRVAALLLCTLLLGALLALIGQTYQTGADPWQLFAMWALLAVPWMIAAKRDLLWSFWILICATGISLWVGARVGGIANILFDSYWQIGVDWLMWFLLVAVAYGIERFALPTDTNYRPQWTLRLALVLALAAITAYAATAIFAQNPGTFVLGLVLVGLVCSAVWARQPRDLAALSVAVLALDVLLISAWIRLLTSTSLDIVAFLIIGLGAAVIVGASVTFLMRIYRSQSSSTDASRYGPNP